MVFEYVSEQLNFHAKDVWGSKGLSKALQLKTKKLIVCRFRVCFGFGMFQVPADKLQKFGSWLSFTSKPTSTLFQDPNDSYRSSIFESQKNWNEWKHQIQITVFLKDPLENQTSGFGIMFYVPADNSQWDLQKIKKKTRYFWKIPFLFLLRFRYLWFFFYGFRLLFRLRSVNKPESKRIKKKYFSWIFFFGYLGFGLVKCF